MVSYIITSSTLLLTVILIRAVLKGRIMLRLQYALWLVVLLRLLIPVQFGSSSLSMMNVVSLAADSADAQAGNRENQNTVVNMIINVMDNTITNVSSNAVSNTVNNVNNNSGKQEGTSDLQNIDPMGAASQPLVSDNGKVNYADGNSALNAAGNDGLTDNKKVNKPNLKTIILACWITVSCILGLVMLVSNVVFRSRLIHTRKKLEIKDYPLPVYISDEVPGSCLFGLFKPVVYLTEAAAEKAVQREFILAHELTHYRHLDHIWSFLRNIVLILHWYNPLVWIAAVLSRRDAELACDEGVVGRLGEQARLEYGRVLLELSTGRNGKAYLLGFSSASSKADLKERINMLVYKPYMKKTTAVVLALVLCIITACTFTGKPDGSGDAGKNQELNNERNGTEPEEEQNEYTENKIQEESPAHNFESYSTQEGTKPDERQSEQTIESIFSKLNNLAYQPYTCDGLPEYSLKADDGTVFYINLSEKWVWRGKDEQAELTDEIILWMEANSSSLLPCN